MPHGDLEDFHQGHLKKGFQNLPKGLPNFPYSTGPTSAPMLCRGLTLC
ncbi:hypothetical protein STH2567 [Symbiobacterium thermophilum IAM 14863]|uniref:Uncharacterized protein n=1 Tax=Symbiobacterium thermophilum (strain DSM 24528 / JCM 14929 / IAM 14863 / T) TaxID=292459 RepID=Q67L94_SYMTH|nr:hypothetical protein STH2567 [Symbiobacterium thermophilum IAM 14863]